MSEQIKQKWYQSTKKTLGVIGFFMYWGLQVPAVISDPSVIKDLSMENAILVSALLGIKTIGNIASKKGA